MEKYKDYYNDNKDKLVKNQKEYYNKNKDKINGHYDCPCGGKYKHCHKSAHFKTMKHIKYTEQQNNNEI